MTYLIRDDGKTVELGPMITLHTIADVAVATKQSITSAKQHVEGGISAGLFTLTRGDLDSTFDLHLSLPKGTS